MRQCEEKLIPPDRIHFQRAIETFPEAAGNCPDEITEFILDIFEVNEDNCDNNHNSNNNNNQNVLQDAINFIITWNEIGINFPQKVINLFLYASFKHPFLVSHLSTISSSYSNFGWLFHSLLSLVRDRASTFEESVSRDFPVWELVLRAIDSDFFAKSDTLSSPYIDRPFSFLIESIVFGLASRTSASVGGAARALSDFLTSARSRSACVLLSTLCALFPDDALPLAGGGLALLQSQCVCFLARAGGGASAEVASGGASVAVRLLPLGAGAAAQIAEKDTSEEAEVAKVVIAHYSSETAHVVTGAA